MSKFLLLLGPSGVGKSAIIDDLSGGEHWSKEAFGKPGIALGPKTRSRYSSWSREERSVERLKAS